MAKLSDAKVIELAIQCYMEDAIEAARGAIKKDSGTSKHKHLTDMVDNHGRLSANSVAYAQLTVARRMKLYTILLLVASGLLFTAAVPPALQAFGWWP